MLGKIASLGAVLALLLVPADSGITASKHCEVTGKPRRQCCASKASPMPPCCMKGCATAGQLIR